MNAGMTLRSRNSYDLPHSVKGGFYSALFDVMRVDPAIDKALGGALATRGLTFSYKAPLLRTAHWQQPSIAFNSSSTTMRFFTAVFAVFVACLCLTGTTLAQFVRIASPPSGTVVHAGKKLLVEVSKPVSHSEIKPSHLIINSIICYI